MEHPSTGGSPVPSLEELARIRGIMDRSQRFLSLSGLSGVAAGAVALATAFIAHAWLGSFGVPGDDPYSPLQAPGRDGALLWDRVGALLLLGVASATIAIASAWWFTWRRARRTGQNMWDAVARRMMMHLAVPLVVGGVFCLALLAHGLPGLVAPATLVFYGMALVNASKFTLDEVRWLGMSQMSIGLFAAFFPGHGLLCWALGFGVLHIGYGTLMYLRHEQR